MALLTKKTEAEAKPVETPAGESRYLATSFANGVLRKPRITEKAYLMNARNEYVFEVAKRATKREVARAVEAVYGVTVLTVRTTSLPGRTRRFGRTIGTVSGVKKAIVKLKEGDSLTLIKAGL